LRFPHLIDDFLETLGYVLHCKWLTILSELTTNNSKIVDETGTGEGQQQIARGRIGVEREREACRGGDEMFDPDSPEAESPWCGCHMAMKA
jgi:hypothetical protein